MGDTNAVVCRCLALPQEGPRSSLTGRATTVSPTPTSSSENSWRCGALTRMVTRWERDRKCSGGGDGGVLTAPGDEIMKWRLLRSMRLIHARAEGKSSVARAIPIISMARRSVQ